MSAKSKSIRLSFYLVFAIVFLLAGGAANALAVCSLSANLIVNPNAEADQAATGDNSDIDVSGWEPETGAFPVVRYTNGNGFPTASSPGPAARGNFFFSGGQISSSSSAADALHSASRRRF